MRNVGGPPLTKSFFTVFKVLARSDLLINSPVILAILRWMSVRGTGGLCDVAFHLTIQPPTESEATEYGPDCFLALNIGQ